MRKAQALGFLLGLVVGGLFTDVRPQTRRAPSSAPKIDVEYYFIQATLNPDAHEIKAVASITFHVIEDTDLALFDLSENLSVQKILDPQGVEILFGQDEIGPGILSVHFSKPLAAPSRHTIKVEYSGGFDRDRYSRLYTRDEASAYIGMEGSYLLYSAKWFPINKFLLDRATAKVEITAPLGMTVVGPGAQLPVVTKGISETFGWEVSQPTLPNSIVAGRYFEKSVQSDAITVNCFAREDHLEAIQTNAKIAAKILAYYEKQFGPSASGHSYRLVEVDDKLISQPGMMGTIFITHRELGQSVPPIRDLARRIAYQWWMESIGVQETADLWLVDGLSYYCAAMYLGASDGDTAFKDEIDNLAVLGLKFENKSPVRTGLSLGFRSEQYESVVAGKGAWICHMLRSMVGDTKFFGLLQAYFQSFKSKSGSAAEFRTLAEKAYGKELNWFFAEWIDSIGVPNLQIDYMVLKTVSGFRVSGSLKQDKDLFRMPVEVEVISQNKPARTVVDLSGKSTTFDISTDSMPKKVVVDPDSKLLRDSRELQTSVQLSLGNDLRLKGNFVEAIKAYENALKLNPRKSLAHFRLAEVFWEQFNLQSAANSFRDALNGDKDPRWIEVWAYIYLGKIYDILNQRQRAMAEYNKAVNTKDDTFGAQAEAKKWIAAPFTRERTTMDKDAR
jgi:aminopeptidase N